MPRVALAAILVVLLAIVSSAQATGSPFERSLNALAQAAAGSNTTKFDPLMLQSMESRFAEYGLSDFSDAFWQGFIEYGSNASNPWGKQKGEGTYEEYNPIELPGLGVTAFEKCNTLSNIAYYRTMLGVCLEKDHGKWSFEDTTVTALVQAFAALAGGSTFFHAQGSPKGGTGVVSVSLTHGLMLSPPCIDLHGPPTQLKGIPIPQDKLDNVPIGLIALTAHQASVSALGDNVILRDLAIDGKPCRPAVESTFEFVDVISNNTVLDWDALLASRVIPEVHSYTLTFGGIVSTVLSLAFGNDVAKPVVKIVANVMLDADAATFLETTYLDTFANATAKAGISLTIRERFSLGLKGVGTLIKMMYAFLWQEEIIPWFGIKDASLNRFGGEAMPYVNALGNALSGFAHYDDNVQKAKNVYPGDTQCRVALTAHSKWHEQAGNALVDLMLLCDDVNRLLQNKVQGSNTWSLSTPSFDGWSSFWSRALAFAL